MKLERFREIALDFCGLDDENPVLVGVSGGPDSLCLIDALARCDFKVVVAHFDHRLRAESGEDARMVQAYAAQRGLPFVLGSGAVAQYAAEAHASLEEAARFLRYQFLFEQARQLRAQAVAVGHTGDDQVETVLMHFLRGAGLAGLKGMAFRDFLADWSAEIPVVRPLLAFWREDTVQYCRENGLSPVMDASNQNTVFFRNRMRHDVIPMLETLNPQFRQNIWRMTQVLAGDEAVVQAAVEAVWQRSFEQQGEDALALRVGELKNQPVGLQRAMLRRAAACLDPGLRDVDYAAVERGVQLLRSAADGQADLVHGLRLVIEGDRLWVTRKAELPLEDTWLQMIGPDCDFFVPGEFPLAARWKVSARWVEKENIPHSLRETSASDEAWLDADCFLRTLQIRRARPGDRFQPLGMKDHSMKVSDIWVNQKLPRRARKDWPLLACDDAILWIPGFRPAHAYRITSETRRALHLRVFREDDFS
jgi:tRNA(Ile)-lysidine synthase